MADKTFASRLRELADWFEAHPEIADMPLVEIRRSFILGDKISIQVQSKEQMAQVSRALGHVSKSSSIGQLMVSRKTPLVGFEASAYASHYNVCERIVTKEIVKEKREVNRPVYTPEYEEVEVEKEVVSWKCPDSLLSGAAS